MSDLTRGTDRGGRRSKRFLSPSQKYEIFLQLIRQEVTMAEAAEAWKVDRTTILRIRTVAKQGALEALSASRPGVRCAQRDVELSVKVFLHQDHAQASDLIARCGLTDAETELLPRMAPYQALWKIGDRTALTDQILHGPEHWFCDTNASTRGDQ